MDRFTFKANDGTSDSNPATVVFDTTRKPLYANDDVYSYTANADPFDPAGRMDTRQTPVGHVVLTNDLSVPIHGRYRLAVQSPGTRGTTAGGSVDLAADGNFVYTPPSPGFAGRDTFTYTLRDEETGRTGNTARVAIDFAGVLPPAAHNHDSTGNLREALRELYDQFARGPNRDAPASVPPDLCGER